MMTMRKKVNVRVTTMMTPMTMAMKVEVTMAMMKMNAIMKMNATMMNQAFHTFLTVETWLCTKLLLVQDLSVGRVAD